MNPPTFSRLKIRDLRKHLLKRCFAIPKLQRSFVWDAGRAAKLLDSMYQGMPIGSLFLWEIDRKSANLIRTAADVLPTFDHANKHIWFVIDGQQRLSVIHQAFEGASKQNDAGRHIQFDRLCFVVQPEAETESPQRIVYRKPLNREFVSLKDILSADWKQHFSNYPQSLVRRLRDCRDRLLNYPLPIITVQGATLEDVGEIFIRLNSQGMRVTSADRAIALMGNLDVRQMAEEVRRSVRDSGFGLDSVDPILMGFNLVAEGPDQNGDPPKLEAMARRWSKRIAQDESEKQAFARQWDKYKRAFLSAVDCVQHKFPVHDETYLPSANMLATLTVYFYHHPGQPPSPHLKELTKWFWATGVAQRYSGRGYHRNIVADARFFEGLARGSLKKFTFTDYLDPVADIQMAQYASRSARTRAFFCLLAAHKPCYLDNGEPIQINGTSVSHANRKHRHHIFPQGQLAAHYPAQVYNGLCNVCYLVSEDNLKIGMKLPRKYLTTYRAAAPKTFGRVMRSHLIPTDPGSGIWDAGITTAFKKFRKRRLALICTAFENEAGIRLFRKS
ncbi:MAG: DUF262 domain-containing protein [Planctomyces sp.]|nr:DUF262 domain-containing protein [Planctomyces sp.]